jgi:tetratricopeptide (TPR) repeat protein
MTQFQKAIIYCKDDAAAEVERFYAQSLDQWGKRDSAFVHYRRAGDLDTTHVLTHFWLYGYYHDVGDYQGAIRELLIAARNQENPALKFDWLKNVAAMMASENMKDESCAIYAELQSQRPDDGDMAQRMLACIGDDPAQRLSTLRAACTADTNNKDICRLYAQEEERAGNDAAALQIYMRFARGDSNSTSAWETVLRSSNRLNESATNLLALRQLARIEPTNADRWGNVVDQLVRDNQLNDAWEITQQKLREFPDNAHFLYLAGSHYARTGNKRSALEYLDRTVLTNDAVWRGLAQNLHDSVESPLSDDEINQAKFFGRKIPRIHRCRIPGREKQNEVMQ